MLSLTANTDLHNLIKKNPYFIIKTLEHSQLADTNQNVIAVTNV